LSEFTSLVFSSSHPQCDEFPHTKSSKHNQSVAPKRFPEMLLPSVQCPPHQNCNQTRYVHNTTTHITKLHVIELESANYPSTHIQSHATLEDLIREYSEGWLKPIGTLLHPRVLFLQPESTCAGFGCEYKQSIVPNRNWLNLSLTQRTYSTRYCYGNSRLSRLRSEGWVNFLTLDFGFLCTLPPMVHRYQGETDIFNQPCGKDVGLFLEAR
jgi:hypothetical protein